MAGQMDWAHVLLQQRTRVWYGKGEVPVHAMKACGGVEVELHSFLTPALDDMSFHLWVSAPNIHSVEGWVGYWADLDALENRKKPVAHAGNRITIPWSSTTLIILAQFPLLIRQNII